MCSSMSIKVFILLLVNKYVETNVDELTDTLRNLAKDGLAVDKIQEHIDTSPDFRFSTSPVDGERALDEVTGNMKDKFARRLKILDTLKEEVQEAYPKVSTYNPYSNCCIVRLHEFNVKLKQKINREEMCVTGQALDQNPQEILPSSITTKMRQLYESDIGLTYIYIATEEGVLYNYPAIGFCKEDYDPRFRPFYVEAVTSQPKDVVVILDTSGSMNTLHRGKTLMKIAIEATQTVINTLNANDRIGIVHFSDDSHTPDGSSSTSYCYNTQLAMATKENKVYLANYVGYLEASGSTFYENALEKAFAYFGTSQDVLNDNRNRTKLILFLTDGKASEKNSTSILEMIREKNLPLRNEIILLTYGLGGDLPLDARNLLQDMANQVANDNSIYSTREGYMKWISDPSDLRREMGTYYSFGVVQDGDDNEVTTTIPYLDAFGSGVLLGICKPFRIANTLKGVICFDLSFGEFVSEMRFLSVGQFSYTFLVDGFARVLRHPLTANPTFVTNTPVFTQLDTLEPGKDQLLDSIRRKQNGNLQDSTTIISPRGNIDSYGVSSQPRAATYRWKAIEGTNYIIGLVAVDDDLVIEIEITGTKNQEFLYHNLDLMQKRKSGIETCTYFNTEIVKERSSVHFALQAFQNPYQYLYSVETVNDVNSYENYLLHNGPNRYFKEQVRPYFFVTDFFREAMKEVDSDFLNLCVWRYFGTENGIIRTYPAVQLPKNYDASERGWYVLAKSNPRDISVTPPYEDAFGAGTLMTITQVIFERKLVHDYDDHVIGVMGMDFTPSFFYNMIINAVDDCRRYDCFVIDRAGFIVIHHDWIETNTVGKDMHDIHISQKEPSISYDMMEKGIMVRQACVNITGKSRQYVNLVKRNGDTPTYKIEQIRGLNAFIVMKKGTLAYSRCDASCRTTGYSSCSRADSKCFCPCFIPENLLYDYCQDRFHLSSDQDPICSPPLPVVDYSEVPHNPSLSKCYDWNCDERTSQESCNSVIGCTWDGSNCLDVNTQSTSKKKGANEDVAWIAVTCVVSIACLLVMFLLCRRLYNSKQCKKRTARHSNESAPRNSETNHRAYVNANHANNQVHTSTTTIATPSAPRHPHENELPPPYYMI